MVATLMPTMAKTVQIRITEALYEDLTIVAAALGKSTPKYAEEKLRAAADADMQKAAKIIQQKADRKPQK